MVSWRHFVYVGRSGRCSTSFSTHANQGNSQQASLIPRIILRSYATERESHTYLQPLSLSMRRPVNNGLTSKYVVADDTNLAVRNSPVSGSRRNLTGGIMDEKYCFYDKIGVLFEELVDVISDNRQYLARRKRTVDQ